VGLISWHHWCHGSKTASWQASHTSEGFTDQTNRRIEPIRIEGRQGRSIANDREGAPRPRAEGGRCTRGEAEGPHCSRGRLSPIEGQMKSHSEPWLFVDELRDEGAHTAIYPYEQLREIQTADAVRSAVSDETKALEDEFGPAVVAPLHRLIWVLNGSRGMFTSHSVVAPLTHLSSFPWAKAFVGVAIIMLSRDKTEWHDRASVDQSCQELLRELNAAKVPENTAGWRVSVGPVNVVFDYPQPLGLSQQPGFGTQLIVSGSGNSRSKAAERCAAAASFISEALEALQRRDGHTPAEPVRHRPIEQ
jgi:hypothetical protein